MFHKSGGGGGTVTCVCVCVGGYAYFDYSGVTYNIMSHVTALVTRC